MYAMNVDEDELLLLDELLEELEDEEELLELLDELEI